MERSIKGEELCLWPFKVRVEDLAISPDGRYLLAMDDNRQVHVCDFPTRDMQYVITLPCRLTSISISRDSKYFLVNKEDGVAELLSLAAGRTVQKYKGHTGGEYTIRSGLGGANESFVISGSEGKASIHMTERCSPRTDAIGQMATYQFITCLAGIVSRGWMPIGHAAMRWPGAPRIHNYGHRPEMMPKSNCKCSSRPRHGKERQLTRSTRWSSKDRARRETGRRESRSWTDD